MSEGPVLRLFSDGLLSKWGFDDGDVPDVVWDFHEERGLPQPDGWHEVLRRLVEERLLPVLDQRVEVTFVWTSHNPVRALTVDGVDVTGQWYGDEEPVVLSPAWVEVAVADVVDAWRS
ncbi:hypothetical protein AB0G15_21600 [Streptosporangium sp. NPDC023825]|uniref:hypothetical protein n=1 Tax=Streptosporangium sp. NPDC023825 TaxID=3154909 RepID=UPI003442CE9E